MDEDRRVGQLPHLAWRLVLVLPGQPKVQMGRLVLAAEKAVACQVQLLVLAQPVCQVVEQSHRVWVEQSNLPDQMELPRDLVGVGRAQERQAMYLVWVHRGHYQPERPAEDWRVEM